MNKTKLAVRFEVLATYNAEVARGIVHTEIWKQRMVAVQAEWLRMTNAQVNTLEDLTSVNKESS